jgi:hypothetical protein
VYSGKFPVRQVMKNSNKPNTQASEKKPLSFTVVFISLIFGAAIIWIGVYIATKGEVGTNLPIAAAEEAVVEEVAPVETVVVNNTVVAAPETNAAPVVVSEVVETNNVLALNFENFELKNK